MAHNKKKQPQNDKMDQLINLVSGLANEMKNIKQEVDNIKNGNKTEAIEPDAVLQLDSSVGNVQRETPYKVIPIAAIRRDEGYVNPKDAPNGGIKKIYMGTGRTFRNKAEATAYLDRVKANNPGQQYDIFPV